ncbi:alpha/beta hydrolase [Amycolatopsis sp. NPDC049691]|uniref:alpha/beta fold hydrolase n=1 Tax=Amycolatopsis sp. NPDC049691 TaxID=3155155 RepID=UPI0034387583
MSLEWPLPDFVDANGTRLAYRLIGPRSRPPVVLLHGLASSGATWRSFALALVASGRQVITPDLRGHGMSSHRDSYAFDDFRLDIEALLDRLGVTEIDLVGHSLGGRIATIIAQHRGLRIRRLVLEEMRPPLPDATTLTLTNLLTTAVRLPRDLGLTARLWSFDRSMVRPLVRQFGTPDPVWWSALPAMTTPTLAVHGGAGSYVPLARLRRAASLIPNCRLVTIEAGHRVHSTRAAEFRAAVLPFLQE